LTPQVLLVIASLVVAVAILLSGEEIGSTISGIGGILWIAAAIWMLVELRTEPRRIVIGLVALAGALVMAAVVKPGNYLEAIVGFAIAGAAVGFAAGPGAARWAMLPAALYFPLHIIIAIGRVAVSGGARSVRTQPPPTDALVQVAMVAAAGIAGYLVAMLFQQREESRPR
jgi:hypothetical protein